MNLGRAPTLRIHQLIAYEIGVAILSGKIKQGAQLDGEIEASQANGVSRTPYREAIRILTAKGMLESRPKAGTRVTPRSRWNLLDPELLAWTFSGEPDPAFVKALFELRGVIEPAAAGFAAERRSEAHVEAMRHALSQMEQFGLAREEGQAADQQFHRLILEAAHNEALATLASSVGAAVGWTTRFKQRQDALPRDPLPEHIDVFDAIAERDASAARRAMARLVALALEDMRL
ncbi:MAG: FadR family transcriptional regulator [Sphingorhabdus sp.]|nr:FadR family transcriptional regulator [Sphingorhabdus sp.]